MKCAIITLFSGIAYTLGERWVVDWGAGVGRGDWSGGRGGVAEGTLVAAGAWPFLSYGNWKALASWVTEVVCMRGEARIRGCYLSALATTM